jgi:hypothetical protein
MTIMPTAARMASLVHDVVGVEVGVYVSGKVSAYARPPSCHYRKTRDPANIPFVAIESGSLV